MSLLCSVFPILGIRRVQQQSSSANNGWTPNVDTVDPGVGPLAGWWGGDTLGGHKQVRIQYQGWVTCCVPLPWVSAPFAYITTTPLLIWTIEGLHQLLGEQGVAPSAPSWSSLWEPWCPKFPVCWSNPRSRHGQPPRAVGCGGAPLSNPSSCRCQKEITTLPLSSNRGNPLVVPEQFHNRLCLSSTLCWDIGKWNKFPKMGEAHSAGRGLLNEEGPGCCLILNRQKKSLHFSLLRWGWAIQQKIH